uniref:Uncharacterized protein n=1 Tax=Ursus maritimus TaxID=29073 RepID=A0A452VEA1_URSMA
VKSQKRDTGYFDNLKANSRNVTDSMIFPSLGTKAVIFFFFFFFFFFAVLDPLDPDTLPDGRIWLFGFNPSFFQRNSPCMESTSKRAGLQGCAQMGLPVLFIMPLLISLVATAPPGNMRQQHLTGETGMGTE